jgi:hypothetical protein
MTLLPAEAFRLDNRNALQPNFMQGLFHLVQLEWFDDRFDLFHLVHARKNDRRPPFVPACQRVRAPANGLAEIPLACAVPLQRVAVCARHRPYCPMTKPEAVPALLISRLTPA